MQANHLYVHVPFCRRRCTYCDFSIAVRKEAPVQEFVSAIRTELGLLTRRTTLELETLYFGGGTPSRLEGDGVTLLLDVIRDYALLAEAPEITLEVNPEDVTVSNAERWIASGVNRFSLGAQSFHDDALGWMHRVHDSGQTRKSFEILRKAGAGNISLDLIFALPESVKRDWRRDLEAAIALEPEHLSLYGLTVESGTPYGRWVDRGMTAEAPEERYADQFLDAHELLAANRFLHYEVSNFARKGFESRHNRCYWSGRPYAAIGPAAHSYDGSIRTWNSFAYRDWMNQLAKGDEPVAGREELTSENRLTEKVYLSLRTSDGLEIEPDMDRAMIDQWCLNGWAVAGENRLRLTAEGWLRLDALAGALTHSQIHF